MIRVKLLFPPHFSVFQPYLALPTLTAFLKERNIAVSQEDLNLASFYYFMQPEYLKKCQDKLENSIRIYEEKDILFEKNQPHYDAICKALLSAPLVIPNIQNAIEFFHSKNDFLDFDKYRLQERIIQQAMQIISVAHYPTNLSLVDFMMDYSPESSKEIFIAIEDKEKNPYIPFFEDYVASELAKNKPDLVGISLTAMSQVIPGLTLANIIKHEFPEVKIVIGGVVPNHLSEQIKSNPKLFTLFDFLIKGEGETPLYRLCESLTGVISLDSVPNLIYSENGSIIETDYFSVEEVNTLPTPDYDGFPLDKYLSPLPLLSVEPARGCYWRKCTFCNQYSIHGNTFRLRDPQLITVDLEILQTKYRAGLFNISNEGVPEKHIKQISEGIIKAGMDIQWYAGAKMKKPVSNDFYTILRNAGCRKLIFGLESGSQRVLDIMKKGTTLGEVPRTLQNLTNAGIDAHLYLMIGFPTEDLEEIKATQDFLLKILSNVNKEGFTFYISVFQAMIAAPIINQLSQLSYEIMPKGDDYDLTYIFKHELINNKEIQCFSRDKLEKISADMASVIYSHLPLQTIPDELTHYMCYRLLDHKNSDNSTGNCKNQKTSYESLLKNQGCIRKNNWVSLRDIKFVKNPFGEQYSKITIVYNFLNDGYYLLNEDAIEYLNCFYTPKTMDQSLNDLALSSNNMETNFKQYIYYLLENKLLTYED